MRAMVASFSIFVVATLAAVGTFGNHGLWFALLLFMAARARARYLPALLRHIGADTPAARLTAGRTGRYCVGFGGGASSIDGGVMSVGTP